MRSEELVRTANGRTQDEIVVAFVRCVADRAAVVSGAGKVAVQFHGNAQRAALAIADARVIGVVLELNESSVSDLDGVMRAIAMRRVPIPVLLRFELRQGSALRMLEHDADALDLRFSLRGTDSLAACVSGLVSPGEDQTACGQIMSRLMLHTPRRVSDVVVGAAVLGGRATPVSQLARVCGCSTRNIEERLFDADFMGPKRLLMRMLALHSHWRISHLGWSGKKAASAAGFRTFDALSRRVERAVGATLGDLCRICSFGDVLAQLVVDLEERQRIKLGFTQPQPAADPRISVTARAF